jgi:hypothetical protein
MAFVRGGGGGPSEAGSALEEASAEAMIKAAAQIHQSPNNLRTDITDKIEVHEDENLFNAIVPS